MDERALVADLARNADSEPAPARRQLSAGRLRRLLEISALVRRNPRLPMADVLRRLKVSRSQFYRDREELQRLGLRFGRRAKGFSLAHDPLLPPVEVALSELLALAAAVSALARSGPFEPAYLALRSLLSLVTRLPGPLQAALEPFVLEAALAEGFGCPLAALEVIAQALSERRRIVIGLEGANEPLTLDPQGVVLADGQLCLSGLWAEEGRPVCLPLSGIAAAGFTPFLAPEPAPPEEP